MPRWAICLIPKGTVPGCIWRMFILSGNATKTETSNMCCCLIDKVLFQVEKT